MRLYVFLYGGHFGVLMCSAPDAPHGAYGLDVLLLAGLTELLPEDLR